VSAKLGFTAGLAIGLLAGSRAGRGLYDRSAATAQAVVNDPRVRRGASTVLHKAGAAGSSVAGAASRKVTQRGRGEANEQDGDDGRGDGAADAAAGGDERGRGGDRRTGAAHHGRGLAGHSDDRGGWRRRGRGRGRARERGHGTMHLGHGAGRGASEADGGGHVDGFRHGAGAWRHRRQEAEVDGMTPDGSSRGMDGHPGISAPSAQEAGRVAGESGRPGSESGGAGGESGRVGRSGGSGRADGSGKSGR
jgi:hypothetical protein